MKKYGIALWVLVLFWASCKKDEGTDIQPAIFPADMVLVLNEGNYTFGNASITMYDPVADTTRQDLFTSVNGLPLGDVAQSMAFWEGKGYIVVNNSGKIEVVDMADFTSAGTITGLTSPRYMLPLGDGRAYVTDLYAERVAIVDMNSLQVTGYIELPGWTEQLEEFLGYVYIANYDSSRIEIIDKQTDTKVGAIRLVGHPLAVLRATDSSLYVSTEPDLSGDGQATITRIDPITRTATVVKPFSGSGQASALHYNLDRNALYYFNGSQVVQATLPDLTETVLLDRPLANWYSLAVGWEGADLYLTDARDYNQKGQALRLNLDTQTVTDSFEVGVIPGNVYFY